MGRTGQSYRARERAQVATLVALLLPVLLGLGSIVMSVGNWYVHKRHLQTQVDAAALAGATRFVGCSFQFGDPVAANAAIKRTALAYAGDSNRDAGTTNLQVQEPGDVHVVVNSDDYWEDGDPVDDPTLSASMDNTFDPDGDPTTPGTPCETKTLEVKATDDDAPLLWGLLPASPSPKSKARVEIRQIREQMRMLPFAVPEIDPAAVVALFVDEDAAGGEVVDWQHLGQFDDPDLPFSEWSTYAGQEDVFVGSDNVGVIILVSKEDDSPSLQTGVTPAEICSQAPNLVACYGGSSNTSGLSFIHGFSGVGGAPTSPQIRDVNVQDLTCGTDDDSAPYFLLTGDCEVNVRVIIDFGVDGDPSRAPAEGKPDQIGAEVVLRAPGCPNKGCAMKYDGQSFDDESIWVTTRSPVLPAAESNDNGRQDFNVEWHTEVDNPATPAVFDPVDHDGSFDGVAHPYVAGDLSGPVLYLRLNASRWDPAAGAWTLVADANSVNKGNTYKYVVEVGLVKPLQLRDPLEDPVLLRYASPSGSLNQALDCDKGISLTVEVDNGCQTPYALNYYDWDNDDSTPNTWADITCSQYGSNDLPPVSTEIAPICVAAKTGDVIAFQKGLKARFETPSCTPNNWPETEEEIDDFFGEDGYDFANDPRYVSLIITDITAFEGTGSTNIPVKYFAGFYATGWDISPHTSGCPGENTPHPVFGTGYKHAKDNGDVWGHFINVVEFSSAGKADDQLCNFDELGNCIAVLVE